MPAQRAVHLSCRAHLHRLTIHLMSLLALWLCAGTAVATPGTPVVVDEGTWTTKANQLDANWTVPDPGSEVLENQYRVTRDSANGAVIRNWTSVGLARSVNITGLSLQSGVSYYIGVRARYGSNQWTATGSSNGITVDNAAPNVTNIDDGGDYTNMRTALSCSWTGSDAVSGVRGYRYSIGTTPGATNVKAWLNVGTNTNVTAGNLSLTSGTRYYFNIEATDIAGNVSVVSSNGIVSDQVAPTVTVQDDGDVTTDPDSLHATWAGSDALSQIGEYIYAIGTVSEPEALVPWTSRGLNTSVTVNGLPLENGVIYYFRVKAIDRAGNYTIGNSDGIRAQVSGPIVNAVGDGGDYTPSSSTLSATWMATGAITEYKYGIGTSPGATNIKGWTAVGLNTSVTVSNLTLNNGVTYYFAVRAYDDSGNYGSGNSDGILVDLANPVMNAVVDTGEFTGDATKLSFSFSGTDGESGIKEYTYAIGTPESPQSIVPWTSSGLITSRTVTGLHLTDGELYIISVYATDNTGHVATNYSDGITVDNSPPTIVFLEDDGNVTAVDDRLSASWYATDTGVGVGGYSYAIGTAPDATDVAGWTDTGMNTSVTRTGLSLQPGVVYYFTLRAVDFSLQSSTAYTDGIELDTAPPHISGVTIDGVTGTTATIRWTTDKPTSGGVDYGTTPGYGAQVSDDDFGLSHAVILNQLTPGQLYHYRITATDDAGASASTGDRTFTTTSEADRHQRLSPAGLGYLGPRVLQSEGKVTFRLGNGEIWVGDLSRATGAFISNDGRNYRMDTGAKTGTVPGPEFGEDNGGWSVFYAKDYQGVLQTWRSRWNGTGAEAAVLTSGAEHQTALPAKAATAPQVALLNLIGSWEDGGNLAWYLENSPANQHVIEQAQGDEMHRNPGRWLSDGRRLVTVDQTTGQLFLLDTTNSHRTNITSDTGFKTAPLAWEAPEYDGNTIVAAVVDDNAIAVYRDLGGATWTRVTTLPIPVESNQTVIATPQAFVAGDKSYIVLTIQDQTLLNGDVTDSEIWVFDLEDDTNVRFAQRCDEGRPDIARSHPEPFVGDNDVFVYYNAPSGNLQEMWVCRTGIPVNDVHPLVDTDLGRVQGVRAGGADAFLALPYAKPPVAELRWQVTTPVAQWSDVRIGGNTLPPRCPQPDPEQPDTAIIGAEDCLYLNVWTPADRVPNAHLPVMFFVHGGGNRTGGTSDPLEILLALDDNTPLYDGAVLADRGDVVVVTIEYRLAALGYLVNDALAANSPTGTSGNYGIADTLEALRWVQRNIEAFGGDPERVLLFGQSGGAKDVEMLVASPLAGGLFSRALLESGASDVFDPDEAEAAGDAFIEEMGLRGAPNLVSRLRSLPLSRIVLADSVLPGGAGESSMGPWVDGYIVATQPSDIINAGAHNDVPVVVGSNAAEFAEDYHNLTLAEFYDLSAQLVPPDSLPGLYAVYPLADFANPTAAYVAMLTDQTYTCVSRTFARTMRQHQSSGVYRYHFRRMLSTNAREGDGAYHGTELLYLFQHMDGVHFSANANDRKAEALMLEYWTHFAANGDPNYPGGAVWPLYDVDTDSYMRLNTTASAGTHLYDDRCNFWESLRTGD